ncbi:hypothetical protein DL768_004430 [Monosporascus sp. mg162]|nr:hypothetical protein DL768_004430 [Monosporascus sp. mg162]
MTDRRERQPRGRARPDRSIARRQDNRSSQQNRGPERHTHRGPREEPREEPRRVYRNASRHGPFMDYDRRGHLGGSARSEHGGYRDGGRYEPSYRGDDDGYERRGYRDGSQSERRGYRDGSQYEHRSHRDNNEDPWDGGRLVMRREVPHRSRSPLRWQSPPRYRSRSRRRDDHPPPRGRSQRPEYYDDYEEDDRYGYHRSDRGRRRASSPSRPRRAPPPPPPPAPQTSGKRVWSTPIPTPRGAMPHPNNRNEIHCGNCDRFHDPRLCRGPVTQGRIDVCPRCGSKRHLFEDCPWGNPAVDDADFFLWYPRQGLAPIATRIDLSDREAVPGHHVRPVHSRQFAQQLYGAEKQEKMRRGLPYTWKTIDYGSLQAPQFEALKNPEDPSLVGYKRGPPANRNPKQDGNPAAPPPGPERGVRQDTRNQAAAMPFSPALPERGVRQDTRVQAAAMSFSPGSPARGVRQDTRNAAAAMPSPEKNVSQDTRNPRPKTRHCWEATYNASWESQEPGYGNKPGCHPGMLPNPFWDPDTVRAMLGEGQ